MQSPYLDTYIPRTPSVLERDATDELHMEDDEQHENWPDFSALTSPFIDQDVSAQLNQGFNSELNFADTTSSDYGLGITDDTQEGMDSLLSSSGLSSGLSSSLPNNPTHPMDRFSSQPTGDHPWFYGRSGVEAPNLSPITGPWREPHIPPSDAASSIITGPGRDSGYKTDEPSVQNLEVPQLQDGFCALQSECTPPRPPSSRRSSSSAKRGRFPCIWPGCPQSFRLQSDLRKHLLRHEIPQRCHYCEKGFANTNDRERHERTVHQKIAEGTKTWRCVFPNCRNGNKTWPRKDNFRAHVKQHIKDDSAKVEQIVNESECIARAPSPQAPPSPASSSNFAPFYTIQKPPTSQPVLSDPAASTPSSLVNDSSVSIWNYSTPETTKCRPKNLQSASPSTLFPIPDSSAWSVSDNLSAKSASAIPTSLRPSGSQRISKSVSTRSRSRSTQRNDYCDSDRFLSQARNPKTSNTEEVVIHHDAESNMDLNSNDPGLIDAMDNIIQQTNTRAEFLELWQNFKNAQRPRKPGHANNLIDHLGTTPRGRHSPVPDKVIIREAHSNDSRGTSRNPRSIDRIGYGKTETNSQHSDCNDQTFKFQCPRGDCGKSFERRSALEKHIRRHDKPYGCTFDACRCSKVFGSKNDWKRHENSRHHQPELWRCEVCQKTFTSEESFWVHLKESPPSIHPEVNQILMEGGNFIEYSKFRRIGANHAETFWCGFCRCIIPFDPEKKGVEQWDERFNHIAAHFVWDKERKSSLFKIEDWLPPNGVWTKGQKESAHETTELLDSQESGPVTDNQTISAASQQQPNSNPRPHSPKRKRYNGDEKNVFICCWCGNMTAMWFESCIFDQCSHNRCEGCKATRLR